MELRSSPPPDTPPKNDELRDHVDLILKFLHERTLYAQEKILRELFKAKLAHPAPLTLGLQSASSPRERVPFDQYYLRSLDDLYPQEKDPQALVRTFGSLQKSLRNFYTSGPPAGHNFAIFLDDDLEPRFFEWQNVPAIEVPNGPSSLEANQAGTSVPQTPTIEEESLPGISTDEPVGHILQGEVEPIRPTPTKGRSPEQAHTRVSWGQLQGAPSPLSIIQGAPWREPRLRWNFRRLAIQLAGAGCFGWLCLLALRSSSNRFVSLGLRVLLYTIVGTLILPVAVVVIWKILSWLEDRLLKRRSNKISIFVASFGEDKPSKDAREAVMNSIRRGIGSHHVSIAAADIRFSRMDYADDSARIAKARAFLNSQDGHLLICGNIPSVGDRKPRVCLRFVPANRDPQSQVFGLTDEYVIPADFGPELGTALAAAVAAIVSGTVKDQAGYVKRSLVPIAKRLTPFVQNIPASMRPYEQATLLFSYGLLQLTIGTHAGEPHALEKAIAAFRSASDLWAPDNVPLKWARAQNNLGMALSTLGSWELGTQRLKEAQAIFGEVLTKWPQGANPLNWAEAHRNLGIVLLELGRREWSRQRLEDGEEAFRAALEELPLEQDRLSWAGLINGIGQALTLLGEYDDNIRRYDEAERLFGLVFANSPGYEAPLARADAIDGVGMVLRLLGQGDDTNDRLEQAERTFITELEECPRHKLPLRWARAKRNLGVTRSLLGHRKGDRRRLNRAVSELREAGQQWTRTQMPHCWGDVQICLGVALLNLGCNETGTARLREALATFREAQEIYDRDQFRRLWTFAEFYCGRTLLAISERTTGTEQLDQAVAAFESVVRESLRENMTQVSFLARDCLGIALTELGKCMKHVSGVVRLCEAVDTFRAALETHDRVGKAGSFATTHYRLGIALVELGKREGGSWEAEHLEKAVVAFRGALAACSPLESAHSSAAIHYELGTTLMRLAERRHDLERYEQAEQALAVALELAPERASARRDLQELLRQIQAKLH
jgi:tetratricopeptide (TPR) repeat protein